MTADTFYNYVSKIFYPWIVDSKIPTPVILFVDGHASHRSLQLSEFCLEHEIVLVSFLPNMTNICQPMDVVVFGPVKQKWAAHLKLFRSSNRNLERMSKEKFCELLGEVVNDTFTSQLIRTSFEKTGLNPFHADSFDYSKIITLSEVPPVEIDQNSTNIHLSNEFLEQLENLIDWKLPGKLEKFKNSSDQWLDDSEANDLFMIWKAAGGTQNVVEETFELYDVIETVDENEL